MARRRIDDDFGRGTGAAQWKAEGYGVRQAMPQPPSPPPLTPEFKSIQGRRVRLNTTGVAPNLIVQSTQLISARVNGPRQWVVTIAQAAKGEQGVTPWSFAEASTPFAPGNLPVIPDTAQAMQCTLRWGAGGTSFVTAFDYPVSGASFGLTADNVDLNVAFKANPVGTVYASLADVPVVGAFMVEGRPVDVSPLDWREEVFTFGGAGNRNWSVKPYSDTVVVNVISPSAADVIDFISAAGQIIERHPIPPPFPGAAAVVMVVDVPSQAVALTYTANAINTAVRLRWQISFQ